MSFAEWDVEPLWSVQRQHCERVLEMTGNVRDAALLLGVGRSTLFRWIQAWANDDRVPWMNAERKLESELEIPIPDRRRLEQALERNRGHVAATAEQLELSSAQVWRALAIWRDEDVAMIERVAKDVAMPEAEIRLLLGSYRLSDYADDMRVSDRTAVVRRQEALELVGRRRYRAWLFLGDTEPWAVSEDADAEAETLPSDAPEAGWS